MRKQALFIRLVIVAGIVLAGWKVFNWNASGSNSTLSKLEEFRKYFKPEAATLSQQQPGQLVQQPQQPVEQPSQQPAVQPPQQPIVQPSQQPAVQPPQQPTVQPPQQPTVQPSQQTIVQQPQQPTVQPSQQPLVQQPQQSTIQQAEQSTVQQPQTTSTTKQQPSPTTLQPSTTVAVKPTNIVAPVFNASSARIPKILHQAFASEMVYGNYLPFITSCLALNPDWTYYLWRDSDAEALISSAYPEFLTKYKNYRDVLERSDSIRYIVLHHFGGVYLDMDVQCVKPFFPALADLNSFLDQERIEQTNIFWGWPYSVMNSAMGSAPGHPFFREVINEMLRQSRIGNAFASTGPAILTQVYKRYTASKPTVPVTLLEPKVMSPLMDVGKNWRGMCGSVAAAKAKPEASRNWRERGCIMLEAKNWRNDDTDNSTICIHRFLHLGYGFAARARQKPFNITARFWPRVRTFK